MEDTFEIAVTGPELLGELDRAGLMNGVDDGFERDGSKTNAIVGQVIVGNELIRVAAEGGLDATIEARADGNEHRTRCDAFIDGFLGQHMLRRQTCSSARERSNAASGSMRGRLGVTPRRYRGRCRERGLP